MKRREFISLLGGAAAAWPLAARAQQAAMPVIGFLAASTAQATAAQLAAFRRGLNGAGFVEGRDVAIEYRWAEDQYDRLPALAADLVDRHVAAIFAGANASALAAKTATSAIPVVFAIGGDPVKLGLVASLNRPGANVTGVSFFANQLETKRLGLLHELVPLAGAVAALINPSQPAAQEQSSEIIEAARVLGIGVHILNARSERDFDAAFAMITQRRAWARFWSPLIRSSITAAISLWRWQRITRCRQSTSGATSQR